jgi:hypothetical protein
VGDKEETKGLISVFKQLFSGFKEEDNDNYGISFETGNATSSRFPIDSGGFESATNGVKLSGASNIHLSEFVLPDGRIERYSIYQEMARSELVSASLQMHIAYALAPDMETGNIIEIESDNPEYAELAKEVNADLSKMINANITSWAWLMCIYGVHYIRPFGEVGKGITDIESNYFTLAKHIKEYMRGDKLSGFTSEYLKEKDGQNIRLAEPWALVALKVPFWSPSLDCEPDNMGAHKYSLYTDLHRRSPIETQNYGTSFLENAYTSWAELSESVRSLRGSRFNASRVDRFIAVSMEGLDPAAAATYMNKVSSQMRQDEEAEGRIAKRKGLIATVWNKIIPVHSGGKGGVTIDTQQTSPDINGIEDTLFNLKRFCSAMGIDPSLIGWGDLMQGGLGDGGWARTSIIAALRANWIRIGIREMTLRLIDIHLAYKYQKTFPQNQSPFVVKFHSINTALAIEKADELQAKADFTTSVATVLDMINQGTLKHSKTFKTNTMSALGISDDDIELILKELEDAPKEDEGGMFESVSGLSIEERLTRLVNNRLSEIFESKDDE